MKLYIAPSLSAKTNKFYRIAVRMHNDMRNAWVVEFYAENDKPDDPSLDVVVTYQKGSYDTNADSDKIDAMCKKIVAEYKSMLSF